MSGAPPPRTTAVVDGLAVVRRRPVDVHDGAPVVVLVHGAMDRAASFGRVMRRLPDRDVVAYDRRGYAASLDAGVAPTLLEHAHDLRRIVEWTGGGSAVVVGHSLGGTIALLLASAAGDAPGMCDVEIAGLGAFESPVPSLPGYTADGGDVALAAAEVGGPPAAAEAFYRLLVGDRTWDRLRAADRAARLAEGAALVAELRDLRRPGGSPDLDAVRVPVLAGAGGQSPAGWRACADQMAARLGGSGGEVWEIASAGHGAHLSHPDEYARYVAACVANAGPPA